MISDSTKNIVKSHLYLNANLRIDFPANNFPEEIIKELKWLFWNIYEKEITTRGMEIINTDKEKAILQFIFDWMICRKGFAGDVQKGLYLVSKQGFGKDIILRAIVEFFKIFDLNFSEYTNTGFCQGWFNNHESLFASPIKINDIKEDSRYKRERESIPFLEFLDYREQINLRRGIIVSSNFLPEALQEELEVNKNQKRIFERVKECFNIIHIKGVISKRIENKLTL